MIIDKLGNIVRLQDKLGIAELKLNKSLSAQIVFATVIDINKDSLTIKYDNGLVDNNFSSNEFIIINNKVVDNQFLSIEQLTLGIVGT